MVRSVSYAVRDGDSATNWIPSEETGSDNNEDVHMMVEHITERC